RVYTMGVGWRPPAGERLRTLNATRIPSGVDDAGVRKELRETFNIEIGAGMGPLAARIWRIGLRGAGATPTHVLLLVSALEAAVSRTGHTMTPGAGIAAAQRIMNTAIHA